MYLINKKENKISKLKQKTFSELNFREREHLQEWIADNPAVLGEELLIIQKEFNGFNETNERLDLLALDKMGNIVVIENKLDDSGKDVTWQAIKYASYCASLTKQDIIKIYQEFLGSTIDARDKLSEFFDGKDLAEVIMNQGTNSQRLILVAANFRKEVTSSVLWLLSFKIRLQCFKVTPFAYEEQLFLNVEQILPIKETEAYAISISTKAQEEIEVQETLQHSHSMRLRFWESLINFNSAQNNLFSNISPSKDNWLGKGIGMTGVNLNLVISQKACRSELYISRNNKEENKEFFDFFYSMKGEIEKTFGDKLKWERMDENVTSRIRYQLDGVSYLKEEEWPKIIEFLLDAALRMEHAFKNPIMKRRTYSKEK